MDSIPDNPNEWTEDQISEAFAYFNDFYGPNGLYSDTLDSLVTRKDFIAVVIEDYKAVMRGKTVHQIFGQFAWEWASVERERESATYFYL